MRQKRVATYEVIMSGLGGKGVLLAGEVLARAARFEYEYVTWFPSYSAAKRGGPCECTTIMSEEEIASPVVSQAGAVVVMEPSQLKSFEKRVNPGGLLIVESLGLKDKPGREDIRVLLIPAVERAVAMGNVQAANFILLGAYLQASGALPLEFIDRELETKFKEESFLSLNKQALREGAKLATEL
jgi:2-oxoglutarate ferredoxin oxidoreductase subunit gamma